MSRPLVELRQEARACTACPLWRNATQTVFGEGDPHAAVMLVGEQPGDAEDLAGRPFVGPAGKLLERALGVAGLSREQTYVTNVVKHFKWELRGKRRLHKTPVQREIEACRPWLDAEIVAVAPALVVCLGATATHALLGGKAALTRLRGRILRPNAEGPALLATVHPSFILRVPSESRTEAFDALVADLKVAARFLAQGDEGV
jgi:uracil-DNA glycosylase family protein